LEKIAVYEDFEKIAQLRRASGGNAGFNLGQRLPFVAEIENLENEWSRRGCTPGCEIRDGERTTPPVADQVRRTTKPRRRSPTPARAAH
jgi:hypothetical protein